MAAPGEEGRLASRLNLLCSKGTSTIRFRYTGCGCEASKQGDILTTIN